MQNSNMSELEELKKPEPLLRVLGPLSIPEILAVSSVLPRGTAMRGAGTVEHEGQTRAVFEFISGPLEEVAE